jgi:transcriptional regulator with XRE-family HTH domain
MALAENIKAKRLEKSMSQEELSGIVGVTKMAISLYEKGERIPDFYTGLRIAKALDTTVEELAETQATQTAPKQ